MAISLGDGAGFMNKSTGPAKRHNFDVGSMSTMDDKPGFQEPIDAQDPEPDDTGGGCDTVTIKKVDNGGFTVECSSANGSDNETTHYDDLDQAMQYATSELSGGVEDDMGESGGMDGSQL